MERVENRMMIESIREHMHHFDFDEDFNGAGWKNLENGTFVRKEDAFDYALDHCTNFVPAGLHKIDWTQEFREMLVDWFYSGGEWVREE